MIEGRLHKTRVSFMQSFHVSVRLVSLRLDALSLLQPHPSGTLYQLTFDCARAFPYYAALLPRRGPHIASHSVCLSVRPVIVVIGNVFSSTASVTDVLFGTQWDVKL